MHLGGQTQASIAAFARARGASAGGASVLARALLAEFAQRPVAESPKKTLLALARSHFSDSLPKADAVADPDGTVRFAVHLDDGATVETVAIHQPKNDTRATERWTICLSSQAGCARGCVFCETGRLGLQRNLQAWEIVAQYALAARHLGERPKNVVFMGMGEPLDNLDEVLRGHRRAHRRRPVSRVPGGAITVSTVGMVPKMREFYRAPGAEPGGQPARGERPRSARALLRWRAGMGSRS